MKITLFGARGFIGQRLHKVLEEAGYEVACPDRNSWPSNEDLGVVVYSIGLTADFRERPFDCFDAHVGLAQRILVENRCDRFVYLSSARIYGECLPAPGAALMPLTEAESIPVRSYIASDAYNVSKLAGESLVLMQNPDNIVARLSNVVGEADQMQSFLGQIVHEIRATGSLTLQSHPDTAKDYISVQAVSESLAGLLQTAPGGIYNICNGYMISHQQWLDHLGERCDFRWQVAEVDMPASVLPISNEKLKTATGFAGESLSAVLNSLVIG